MVRSGFLALALLLSLAACQLQLAQVRKPIKPPAAIPPPPRNPFCDDEVIGSFEPIPCEPRYCDMRHCPELYTNIL